MFYLRTQPAFRRKEEAKEKAEAESPVLHVRGDCNHRSIVVKYSPALDGGPASFAIGAYQVDPLYSSEAFAFAPIPGMDR